VSIATARSNPPPKSGSIFGSKFILTTIWATLSATVGKRRTSSSAASKISYLLRALHDLCVLKLRNLMKKYLVLIATVSLALGACERHPASQLPAEGEGVTKGESGATQEKQTTPEASPSGTPKTYFPQNS
jgi:hypothetical protein